MPFIWLNIDIHEKNLSQKLITCNKIKIISYYEYNNDKAIYSTQVTVHYSIKILLSEVIPR